MPLHDLNQAQLRTLRALAKEKQPIPIALLAEKLDASRGTIGSQVRRLLDEGLAVVVDKQGNAWGFPIEAHSVAGYRAMPEIRYLVNGR